MRILCEGVAGSLGRKWFLFLNRAREFIAYFASLARYGMAWCRSLLAGDVCSLTRSRCGTEFATFLSKSDDYLGSCSFDYLH